MYLKNIHAKFLRFSRKLGMEGWEIGGGVEQVIVGVTKHLTVMETVHHAFL